MGGQDSKKTKKHICAGLLAHVDAGKTTLSEGLLFAGGMIRQMGRVDRKDAYLDTYAYEKERGITIFSKQACIKLSDDTITLLDTPGHVDFSAEMERTLQALDYAILIISGSDGIQGHTRTLWRLLQKYRIPVFLFVNKMDQPDTDRQKILRQLKTQLSDGCIAFDDTDSAQFWEEIAMCSENALEEYLSSGTVEDDLIQEMIVQRKIIPCYFGSALKYEGVTEFLQGFCRYSRQKDYSPEFGAKVFKIARDESGQRLTYLKITGGRLKVREALRDEKKGWEEKVSQIRIYSGAKYETVHEVDAGGICAVVGLSRTYPGEGLGTEEDSILPVLDPVLTYRILLPKSCDAVQILPKLRQLEEEEPELHLLWNETYQEILVQVMGEVQTEILKKQVWDRFGVEIEFDAGHIVYKETIAEMVEGVGHFEPLRHYAEVHLLLEPGKRGSGLVFAADCSEDLLDKNWQRLILTHLKEKAHIGTLTGSAITDMKITLVSGRAHQKHTEGGDFRQAVYRAVRQGLMQTESILLEPYYTYRLEVPEECLGRAMTDIKMRLGTMQGPEMTDEYAALAGKAPVSAMQEYAKEVSAYTKGRGRLFLSYGGYDLCRNQEEAVREIGYDAGADVENPSSSVFCSHGAGTVIEWDHVAEWMHLESALPKKTVEKPEEGGVKQSFYETEEWIDEEEVDAILSRTSGANRRDPSVPKRRYKSVKRISALESGNAASRKPRKEERKEEYLLVDGYNILYAWEELRELAKENIDGARGRLLDLLCNYQAMQNCHLIAVFDAYRVAEHQTEISDYHNIHVVFTKEAETADAYIEKFAHDNADKYHVTVATSDGMEQIIIRGAGCRLLSAQDFWQEMVRLNQDIQEEYKKNTNGARNYLMDGVAKEVREQMQEAFTK